LSLQELPPLLNQNINVYFASLALSCWSLAPEEDGAEGVLLDEEDDEEELEGLELVELLDFSDSLLELLLVSSSEPLFV
jgi:hypothetical protein